MRNLKSFQFLGWILVLVLINVLSVFFHTGIDLTAEKRYTLSTSTEILVNSLDQPMKLTVYMDGDLPAGFKKLADRAEDISSAFRSMSKGNFVVEFERPGAGLNDTATTEIYTMVDTLSLHDALPIYPSTLAPGSPAPAHTPYQIRNSES